MRRAWILLLLLLPARAASLWALPRCQPAAAVCHMGPDGGSCCPAGDCSMQECNRPDPGVVLTPAPSMAPVHSVRLPSLEPAEKRPPKRSPSARLPLATSSILLPA